MRRTRSLTGTTRTSEVDLGLDRVWAVAASGRCTRQWYADAAPFVLRGALDRLAGGEGRRWDPPGTPLLHVGDRAAFWEVAQAVHDGDERRLAMRARVRAPGLVQLHVTARGLDHDRTRLELAVTLAPRGILGAAYLLADLPAREAVAELAHRALLGAVVDGSGA